MFSAILWALKHWHSARPSWTGSLHLSAGNLKTNSEACGIVCMQLVVLRETTGWWVVVIKWSKLTVESPVCQSLSTQGITIDGSLTDRDPKAYTVVAIPAVNLRLPLRIGPCNIMTCTQLMRMLHPCVDKLL